MSEYNRFSEHYRIDQYLKKKSTIGFRTISTKKNENLLSNFPIGLIIITKEVFKLEDKIDFINQYACKLFRIKDNTSIKELKEKFSEFVKLKSNFSGKTNQTLNDVIFNNSTINAEIDNFIPFESSYSKSIILYIKINEIGDEKFIVIDKNDKYIEERKYIELNLIKAINYQYLHTLFHELNNPLNALLALGGERNQFTSSDITNSRIENKSSIMPKKTNKPFKKSNNYLISLKKEKLLSLSSNKIEFNPNFDLKSRKKTIIEGNNLNDKIPLLVNIIKIFIKNFILYLKTRADNLIMLKNEFESQNETSDIINAVEVSDYEKELTRHNNVKMNLEYIFDLYFRKFNCLFKYKEIEVETNFEKLRNLYVVTDEFNFIYYIRQIYTYLYYIVPKKEGFTFEFKEEENNTIKIIVKKNNNDDLSKSIDDHLINCSKDNKTDMNQLIQTKEMTKEVLYSMSKRLNFLLEINDNELSDKNNINKSENNDTNNKNENNNTNDNIYLCITMPIQKKDKSDEEDDFKDEDINEMIQKDNFLLEDKLRRQFPNVRNNEQKSNNSTNNIVEMLNKSGEDKKDSESFTSLQKKETNLNFYSNNNLSHFKKNSEKSLSNINNESQKKMVIISKKSNDNFLNKCLKISEKESKEKDKLRHKNGNHLKVNSKPHIQNHRSDKNILYNNQPKNTEKETKSQKLSGVFTKINNFGCLEELDYNDMSISNIIKDNKNNKKHEDDEKNNKGDIVIKDNKLNSQLNMEINYGNQISTNFKTSLQGTKNSKFKNSLCGISDIIGEESNNKNINININNNNIIHIINNDNKNITEFNLNDLKNENFVSFIESNYKKEIDKKNPQVKDADIDNNKKMSSKNSKLNVLPEIDNKRKKRFSQRLSPKINAKDCMTFFSGEKKENVSKDKKTILNESIRENEELFIKANKEMKLHLEKTDNKNLNNFALDNEIEGEEAEEENEEYEDLEENNQQEEEKFNCNCVDILVVDDEKFNVMATQKMIKNIGYESDAAYNGEECINLIKEKQKLNCKCQKNYYKLIFLDIVMPVLDGISAAKKIQEMIDNKEINENLNIIFVSGNIDGSGLKNSLLEIGCVKECLQKPVRIDKYKKIFEKYYKDI